MNVPFNDLTRIHKPIQTKILKNFEKLVNQSAFVLNKEIYEFEKKYAKYCGTRWAVSCSNGTDALELILRSLDIGYGDEVIIPSNTFIATALAVTRSGATPVLVDCNNFFLIDPIKISKKINKKTKAIIGVNLYGQLIDYSQLNKLVKKYKIYLIEDSAQSHGATQNGKKFNSSTIASAYSFYPGKNLGAWGDGGIVTTNNEKLYNRMVLIRNWGSKEKYKHDVIGFNSRLQPLQSIVLTEKLKYLDDWNYERNEIANYYIENLNHLISLELPLVFSKNYHVWHLFVIKTKNRNELIDKCMKDGVQLLIHYPYPIHKQKAYKKSFSFNKNELINSENDSSRIVSLPIFPKMQKKEMTKVVSTISKNI